MASGTDYHGYIRADAFTLSAPELERIVSESDDIGKTAILWNVSPYAESVGAVVRSYEFLRAVDTEDALGHFYIDITEGGFPEDDSGILVDPLFFPDAAVGDMITLFYIKDTGYIDSAEFIVTGLINSRTDTKRSAVIRYSGTLADTYGFSPMHMNVYFSFQSDRGLSEKFRPSPERHTERIQASGRRRVRESESGILRRAVRREQSREYLARAVFRRDRVRLLLPSHI